MSLVDATGTGLLSVFVLEFHAITMLGISALATLVGPLINTVFCIPTRSSFSYFGLVLIALYGLVGRYKRLKYPSWETRSVANANNESRITAT